MTIIALAQRLKPEEARDFDRAVKELENAVVIALDVIARGKGGVNDGEFIDGVLARVAELTKKGRFDSGARAVDAALAELERRKAEQEKVVRRSRLALLEAGIGRTFCDATPWPSPAASRPWRRSNPATAPSGWRRFVSIRIAITRKATKKASISRSK